LSVCHYADAAINSDQANEPDPARYPEGPKPRKGYA
jgi:hypothetical protein